MTDKIQAAIDAAEAAAEALDDVTERLAFACGEGGEHAPSAVGRRAAAALRTAVEGLREAGQPVSGWKPVPVEPTTDMLVDGQDAGSILAPRVARIWSAMLAAAPPSPAQSAGDVVAPMEMRAAVQQAYLALEELQGPGFLIGGVMHHRIGLILPKLNEVINALATPASVPPAETCKGANCSATDGISHSAECRAEHNATVSAGTLDTPGNRHPDCRYEGYKGRPLPSGATADQSKAWHEGRRAAGLPAEPVAADAGVVDEHAAFAQWCRDNGHGVLDDMLTPLDRSLRALMWTVWQGRAALAAQTAGGVRGEA